MSTPAKLFETGNGFIVEGEAASYPATWKAEPVLIIGNVSFSEQMRKTFGIVEQTDLGRIRITVERME